MAKIVLPDPEKAAKIIRDAGGTVVGRTRLQKMAYLLEVTHLGVGFSFEYKHYGPFSEQLADAVSMATLLGIVSERVGSTTWGGTYSTFMANGPRSTEPNSPHAELIKMTVEVDPIALELAATAVFLAKEGERHPWAETQRRKPEKAKKLVEAKALYASLLKIETPVRLPRIAD